MSHLSMSDSRAIYLCNYNKNKPWQKNRLETVSEKYFTWGGGGGGGGEVG